MLHDKANTLGANLIRVGDLINHDGPELSMFFDVRNNNLYLFYWVDYSNESNTWLIFQVPPSKLRAFIDRKISLKKLILDNPYQEYMVTEIKRGFYLEHTPIIPIEKLTSDHYPTADTFFDVTFSPQIEKIHAFLKTNFPSADIEILSPYQKLSNYFSIAKKYIPYPLPYSNDHTVFDFSDFIGKGLSIHK